ncbi:metal ABC transporter [Enterocloster citroniae]|uniref:Metal ABC transporter n=1 Tax=Enterocloster citroniae TaxID=358743 RepID=A0AA41FIP2_9FIRM|nr:divalent metal cation transporter [Enterocloster citroniae]MBT9812444.1 metal ABC transporter [Enterocloster citroniae]
MENTTNLNISNLSENTFDESKVEKLSPLELLKRVGPGIVLTGIVIGPGAVTTAAMIGAKYGYSLMWMYIMIAFMGSTYVMATYRLSLLTGIPTIHAIRHYYGPAAAGFTSIALFLTCCFFTIGNISGTGAGMSLIFGINWKLGAVIMIAVLVYCYFSKGVYGKVEKGVGLCVIGMIIAFYVVLIGTGGPDWSQFGVGLVKWQFPEGSMTTALGFLSTHAALTTGIYGTYLGAEKKWKKEDLFNGTMMADSIAHVVGVILISAAVMLVAAIVLNPIGKVVSSPTELAEMLVPVMGSIARPIMGVALLGAGFSSLLGNTQRGVVLLNAGFDRPTSLEDKSIRIGALIVLAVSAVICFAYGGSPTQLIFIANLATAIATPVSGLFIVMMLWRKDTNGGLKKAPTALRVCMTGCYIVCLFLTFSSLKSLLGF